MGNAVVTEGLELSFAKAGEMPFEQREGHVLASVDGRLVLMGGSSEDPKIHAWTGGSWDVLGGYYIVC